MSSTKILPASKTRILSQSITVCNLCATDNTVQFANFVLIVPWISVSVSLSMFEVAYKISTRIKCLT